MATLVLVTVGRHGNVGICFVVALCSPFYFSSCWKISTHTHRHKDRHAFAWSNFGEFFDFLENMRQLVPRPLFCGQSAFIDAIFERRTTANKANFDGKGKFPYSLCRALRPLTLCTIVTNSFTLYLLLKHARFFFLLLFTIFLLRFCVLIFFYFLYVFSSQKICDKPCAESESTTAHVNGLYTTHREEIR